MIIGIAYLLVLASVPLARGRLSALADLPLRQARRSRSRRSRSRSWSSRSCRPATTRSTRPSIWLSYVLLGAFAFANRRIVGVPIIALGGLLNFIAIAANGGVMPTSADAVESVGHAARRGRVHQLARDRRREAPVPRRRLRHAGLAAAAQRLQHRRRRSCCVGVFVLVHVACGSRIVPRRWSPRARGGLMFRAALLRSARAALLRRARAVLPRHGPRATSPCRCSPTTASTRRGRSPPSCCPTCCRRSCSARCSARSSTGSAGARARSSPTSCAASRS